MSRLNWHPRYHRAFLEGTQRLSLEERGCYTTILDLIYDRGGPIPDDARWLAGWMNCSVRKWNVIRSALIAAGKIIIEGEGDDAVIRNERADVEIDTQSARRRVNAESGAKGGRKKRVFPPKLNGNNDNDQAVALAKPKLKTETETEEGSVDKSTGAESTVVDHDKAAWADAVGVLTTQGGMTEQAARKFFGQLLGRNRIEARDLLSALTTIRVNGTLDPQGLLTRHAQSVARRRLDAAPKRVGWV